MTSLPQFLAVKMTAIIVFQFFKIIVILLYSVRESNPFIYIESVAPQPFWPTEHISSASIDFAFLSFMSQMYANNYLLQIFCATVWESNPIIPKEPVLQTGMTLLLHRLGKCGEYRNRTLSLITTATVFKTACLHRRYSPSGEL